MTEFEVADSTQTEKRQREIQIIVNILQPDPEYQPFILTDESMLHDIAGDDYDTIRDKLAFYFGGEFNLELKKYIWQVVDDIKQTYTGWPDDWPPDYH